MKPNAKKSDGSLASSEWVLPSLLHRPPSSKASGWDEATHCNDAKVAAPSEAAALPMADERPTHPTCVEAGRQGFFQEESRGTKRYRAAPIEPARDYLAPASSSGPEQVPLTDMVALADIEHDETVAALYDIVGPVQDAGTFSTCSTFSICSSTVLPPLSGFSGDATDLPCLFARIFIPRHPNALPRSKWLSYPRLFSIVQLYAPARVWKQGPGNLKGFVIEWCKCLPTFAGLEQREWCMRLNDRGVPGQKKPSSVYKFCLECAL